MAVACLSKSNYGYFLQPHFQTQKSADLCAQSVSGGRRKCPYNGDKLKARAITRAKSRTVTIILYLVNFLRSQIPSITSYCRYFITYKITLALPPKPSAFSIVQNYVDTH